MLATNISLRKISQTELYDQDYQKRLVNFLFTSLEKYSDPLSDIFSCLHYIMDEKRGGHVFVAEHSSGELCGVVFLTKTKMETFVPEFLLVYIATAKEYRGQGIGHALLSYIKNEVKAPIALHVEYDNPAKKLYEKLGFTSKYAEMRWYP